MNVKLLCVDTEDTKQRKT